MEWNTAIQIAISIWMLSWITTRLHKNTGRFWAVWLGTGELTDLKRLGQCFFLNSQKTQKTVAHTEVVFNPHPLTVIVQASDLSLYWQCREIPVCRALQVLVQCACHWTSDWRTGWLCGRLCQVYSTSSLKSKRSWVAGEGQGLNCCTILWRRMLGIVCSDDLQALAAPLTR